MKVPGNPDDFPKEDYPHFQVFCIVQLERSCRLGEHFGNAKIIAAVPYDEIRLVTLVNLPAKGLMYTAN